LFSVEVVLGVAEVDFSVGFGGGLFWLGHGLRESLGGSVDRICELVSQVKGFVRICFWSIARFCNISVGKRHCRVRPQYHEPIPPIQSCTASNKSCPSTGKPVNGNSCGVSVIQAIGIPMSASASLWPKDESASKQGQECKIKAMCCFCRRFLSCGINRLNSGALRTAGMSASAGKIA